MSIYFQDYDVFLFDFDGLLVDSEPYHYQSFLHACAEYGCDYKVGFDEYYQMVSLGRLYPKEDFIKEYPEAESVWDEIYQMKDRIFLSLLLNQVPILMPGAEKLLRRIRDAGKKSVLVTNSSEELVNSIVKERPELSLLSAFITREGYKNPKPASDGYEKAFDLYVREGERVIGFEDSLKGVLSLAQVPAMTVAVNRYHRISQKDVLDALGDTPCRWKGYDYISTLESLRY